MEGSFFGMKNAAAGKILAAASPFLKGEWEDQLNTMSLRM